jgi:hypothetical protein
MQLEDVRQLKSSLLNSVTTAAASSATVRSLGIRSQGLGHEAEALRSMAIGISRRHKQHQLAVRVQRRALLDHPLIDRLRQRAHGEIDVRYVGRINKRETPATLQRRRRPLVIGCSIGHFRVTAGTLGCFVQSRTDQTVSILSNNHVLANENRGKAGDAILQPGDLDGGRNPQDVVAKLSTFVRLKPRGTNFVDCALAEPVTGIKFNARKLGTFGLLKGLGPEFLDEGARVRKVGRTTGETKGRVTAFELDNVVVEFDIGNLRFDNQIEIEGIGKQPFSDGGDSGSLIINSRNQGVGLLFAGGDIGGTNGMGLTYANPLRAVLDALNVDLVFS